MASPSNVIYAREQSLDVREFREGLVHAGLGATRPIEDVDRLNVMLTNSNFIVTARLDEPDRQLVGFARSITDFAWCCYLSELVVMPRMQGRGIGRGLLEDMRRQLGSGVSIILISYPEALPFYQRIGLADVPNTFWDQRTS